MIVIHKEAQAPAAMTQLIIIERRKVKLVGEKPVRIVPSHQTQIMMKRRSMERKLVRRLLCKIEHWNC